MTSNMLLGIRTISLQPGNPTQYLVGTEQVLLSTQRVKVPPNGFSHPSMIYSTAISFNLCSGPRVGFTFAAQNILPS